MAKAVAAEAGTLLLAAVPLGRPEDASERLRAALGRTPVVAAEDTRRMRRLARDLGVTPTGRIVSYYEPREAQRTEQLLGELRAGRDVLLVTDSGMPTVSDPGYQLVTAAVEAGVPVQVLPGPSAVTAALAVSGLPTDRFCFEGFLPRRRGARDTRLAGLAAEQRTMVFFEAPHRLGATLSAMAEALGPERRAAACRELTKTYEEVARGSLAELAAWAADGVRGEITVVVAGAEPAGAEASPERLAAEVAAREAAGTPRKTAIPEVARERGLPKRVVYDAVVRFR